jgi:hypothetical protein
MIRNGGPIWCRSALSAKTTSRTQVSDSAEVLIPHFDWHTMHRNVSKRTWNNGAQRGWIDKVLKCKLITQRIRPWRTNVINVWKWSFSKRRVSEHSNRWISRCSPSPMNCAKIHFIELPIDIQKEEFNRWLWGNHVSISCLTSLLTNRNHTSS